MSRARLRVAVVAVGLLLGVAVSLVLTRPDDPSAQYFWSTTAAVYAGPSVGSKQSLVIATKPPPQGVEPSSVSRPNHALTPGAVAVTDIATVCNEPKKLVGQFKPKNPLVPPALAQAAFAAYKLSPSPVAVYALDYLIPLQLGGAQTIANVWPMHLNRGLGFHEKQVLNIRMHVLVCHNEMRLADAQKAIATDWIALWMKYGS